MGACPTPTTHLADAAVDLARELLAVKPRRRVPRRAAPALSPRATARRRQRPRVDPGADRRGAAHVRRRRRSRNVSPSVSAPFPTDAVGRSTGCSSVSAAAIGRRIPTMVMPLVRRRIRSETRGIVLSADDPAFARHLARRASDGFDLNVNLLGEAILGRRRGRPPAGDRARDARLVDDVDYVSVKISALVANLDVLAFDAVGRARLRAPARALPRRAATARPPTFVNLDMEEYRDLELTVAAFMRVLDEQEFAATRRRHRPAGLPAGLPRRRSTGSCAGRARRERRAAAAGSRSGSSRARTWRWSSSRPSCTAGSPRRTRRRPTSTPATRRCSTRSCDADVRRACSTSASRATTCSTWRGRSTLVAATRLRRIASSSRCSRAWRRRRRAPSTNARGRCCSTRRSSPPTTSPPASPTSRVASTRTPQPENFLRALFTLQPGSPEFDEQATRFRRAVASAPHDRDVTAAAAHDRAGARSIRQRTRDRLHRPGAAGCAAPCDARLRARSRVTLIGDVDRHRRRDATRPRRPSSARRRPRDPPNWLLAVADVMRAQRFETTRRDGRTRPARRPARAIPRCARRSTSASTTDGSAARTSNRSPIAATHVSGRGRGRGRLAVELPVRHPGRRRRGGAHGGERRDPQAGTRGAASSPASGGAVLVGRRSARSPAVRASATTDRRQGADHPSIARHGGADGIARHRAMFLDW